MTKQECKDFFRKRIYKELDAEQCVEDYLALIPTLGLDTVLNMIEERTNNLCVDGFRDEVQEIVLARLEEPYYQQRTYSSSARAYASLYIKGMEAEEDEVMDKAKGKLKGLMRYKVAKGRTQAFWEDYVATTPLEIGGNQRYAFEVFRGSSYPCDLCDSMVGIHYDVSELPPYHGHCCCYVVPIIV